MQRYRAEAGDLDVGAVSPKSNEPITTGRLSFVDNRVEPATGTIQLKATFANDPVLLWPGQFVNVARPAPAGATGGGT